MVVTIRLAVDAGPALRLLRASREGLARAVATFVAQGAVLVEHAMKDQIDQRTRARRSRQVAPSVQVLERGATRATIGPTHEASLFFDQPTRPHVIVPRTKKALAFPLAGGVRAVRGAKVLTRFRFGGKTVIRDIVFARRVFHPGTRGAFYLDATADAVQKPLEDLLDEKVRAELRRAEGGA